jgi:hypothetical protein
MTVQNRQYNYRYYAKETFVMFYILDFVYDFPPSLRLKCAILGVQIPEAFLHAAV